MKEQRKVLSYKVLRALKTTLPRGSYRVEFRAEIVRVLREVRSTEAKIGTNHRVVTRSIPTSRTTRDVVRCECRHLSNQRVVKRVSRRVVRRKRFCSSKKEEEVADRSYWFEFCAVTIVYAAEKPFKSLSGVFFIDFTL